MGAIKNPGENAVSVKAIAATEGHLDGCEPVTALL